MSPSSRRGRLLAAFLLGAILASGVTAAGAAKLLTGRDIKDGSIALKDLAEPLRVKIAKAGTPGPAGPAGPAGAPGAAGPQGPAGPSQTRSSGFSSNVLGTFEGLVVGSNISPGAYLIQTNVVLTNPGSTPVRVECRLWSSVVTMDLAAATLDSAGGVDTTTLSMAGVIDNPSPAGMVNMTCRGSVAGVEVSDADIVVTKVGAVG